MELINKKSPLGQPEDLSKADTLEQVRKAGYELFSLGPVYVYAGVKESLPNKFAEETSDDVEGRSKDIRGTTVHFERPIVARCAEWNMILDIMDTESFQWFKKWMLSMQFTDRVARTFYVPRHYVAPVLDPIAFDRLNQSIPSGLDVFSVSGMKGSLRPVMGFTDKSKVKSYVDFVSAPPDEDVQIMGKKVLDILKDLG